MRQGTLQDHIPNSEIEVGAGVHTTYVNTRVQQDMLPVTAAYYTQNKCKITVRY
jgi:hypothetical protein